MKIVLFTVLLALSPFLVARLFGSLNRWIQRPLTGSIASWSESRHGDRIRSFTKLAPNARAEIVFIHGTPADASAFREQFIDDIGPYSRTAYDRPGFRNSSRASTDDYSLAYQVDALRAILAKTTLPKILVGHSYGAPIALKAALAKELGVRGVLLVGASVDPAQEKTLAIQRIIENAWIAPLLPLGVRTMNRELIHLESELRILREETRGLIVPVLMLHGERDHLTPIANVPFLESLLAEEGKASLFSKIVVPTFDHFIPWEEPKAMKEALTMLLEKSGLKN